MVSLRTPLSLFLSFSFPYLFFFSLLLPLFLSLSLSGQTYLALDDHLDLVHTAAGLSAIETPRLYARTCIFEHSGYRSPGAYKAVANNARDFPSDYLYEPADNDSLRRRILSRARYTSCMKRGKSVFEEAEKTRRSCGTRICRTMKRHELSGVDVSREFLVIYRAGQL